MKTGIEKNKQIRNRMSYDYYKNQCNKGTYNYMREGDDYAVIYRIRDDKEIRRFSTIDFSDIKLGR